MIERNQIRAFLAMKAGVGVFLKVVFCVGILGWSKRVESRSGVKEMFPLITPFNKPTASKPF